MDLAATQAVGPAVTRAPIEQILAARAAAPQLNLNARTARPTPLALSPQVLQQMNTTPQPQQAFQYPGVNNQTGSDGANTAPQAASQPSDLDGLVTALKGLFSRPHAQIKAVLEDISRTPGLLAKFLFGFKPDSAGQSAQPSLAPYATLEQAMAAMAAIHEDAQSIPAASLQAHLGPNVTLENGMEAMTALETLMKDAAAYANKPAPATFAQQAPKVNPAQFAQVA